jgi:hypothetical protein
MLIKLKRLTILLESGYCNSIFKKSLHFSFEIGYRTKAYERYLAKQREDALFKYTMRQIAKPINQDIRANGDMTIGN